MLIYFKVYLICDGSETNLKSSNSLLQVLCTYCHCCLPLRTLHENYFQSYLKVIARSRKASISELLMHYLSYPLSQSSGINYSNHYLLNAKNAPGTVLAPSCMSIYSLSHTVVLSSRFNPISQ